MMRLLTTAGLFFVFVGTTYADDPCQAIGIPGSLFKTDGTCHTAVGQPYDASTRIYDSELLARIINNQKEEITALKAAIDSLTKAVASLESTSKNLVAADQKWQTDTLNKTIAAVDKLPGTLAAQKTLQDILIAAIKVQLLKDSTFLEAVKKAP